MSIKSLTIVEVIDGLHAGELAKVEQITMVDYRDDPEIGILFVVDVQLLLTDERLHLLPHQIKEKSNNHFDIVQFDRMAA